MYNNIAFKETGFCGILKNNFFFLLLKIKQITLNVDSEHDNRQESCNHGKRVLQNLLASLFQGLFILFMYDLELYSQTQLENSD